MDHLPSARRDGLIVEALGDELLVYDGERNRAHSLNRVAAVVPLTTVPRVGLP